MRFAGSFTIWPLTASPVSFLLLPVTLVLFAEPYGTSNFKTLKWNMRVLKFLASLWVFAPVTLFPPLQGAHFVLWLRTLALRRFYLEWNLGSHFLILNFPGPWQGWWCAFQAIMEIKWMGLKNDAWAPVNTQWVLLTMTMIFSADQVSRILAWASASDWCLFMVFHSSLNVPLWWQISHYMVTASIFL